MVYVFKDLDLLFAGVVESGNPIVTDPSGHIWSFVLLHSVADFEQHVAWGITSYGTHAICRNCKANRGDLPYTDMRPEAAWKPSEEQFTNSDFIEAASNGDHPLRKSQYWRKDFVRDDIMHMLDHRGISCHIVGTVWVHLMRNERRLGGNQARRLAELNSMKSDWQSGHMISSKLPNIRKENLFDAAGWAFLKGPLVKSANTRHVVPFCGQLCERFFNDDRPWPIALRTIVQSLLKIYDVLYNSGIFLDRRQHQQLQDAVDELGRSYMLGRQLAHEDGKLYLNIVPKCHFSMHLPRQCRLLNARYVQCYAMENTVGVLTKVWASCKYGPYNKVIQRRVLFKWLIRFIIKMDL